METKKIPCEGCITLPICKQLFVTEQSPYEFILAIKDKCSICVKFSKYNENDDPDDLWWTTGENLIYNFFSMEVKRGMPV